MNSKSVTIGYIRNGDAIVPIQSTSAQFWESSLETAFEARIVPLQPISVDSGWTLYQDRSILPPELTAILDTSALWLTNPTAKSDWALLTYTQTKAPEMSRSGTLLHRNANGALAPITVIHDGLPFLVELKGCGCPTGGFPGPHLRRQAGSFTGFHLRLTGAMTTDSALAEIANLTAQRRHRWEQTHDIFALGHLPFTITHGNASIEGSLLLRLVPSSIRLSFTGLPELDKLNADRPQHYYETAGREVAHFLSATPPQIHRNICPNNCLYAAPHPYILTDYEEANPADAPHCNLDIIEHCLPREFLEKSVPHQHLSQFIAGFNSASPVPIDPKTISTPGALNSWLMSTFVYPFTVKSRLENGPQPDPLFDLINWLIHYLPPAYFNGDIHRWVAEWLIPRLGTKKDRLSTPPSPPSPQTTGLSDQPLNAFVPENSLEEILDFIPDDPVDRRYQTAAMTNVLDHAHTFLKTGDLDIPDGYISLNWEDRKVAQDHHGPSYIFPFIGFCLTYLFNEYTMIKSELARSKTLKKPDLDILNRCIAHITETQQTLVQNPIHLYEILCRSKDQFIAKITVPYR